MSPSARTTAEFHAGGASMEAIGGGAAVVLSIIGLASYWPFYMTAVAVIAAGAGLFLHGSAVAARSRQAAQRFHEERGKEVVFGEGISTEVLGGAAGIVLGILSLAGILPAILLPISVIVLGGSLLLSGPPETAHLEITTESGRHLKNAVQESLRAAAGVDVLVGAGAVVLGILGLILRAPVNMTLVATLAIGGALLVSGGALAMGAGRHIRHV